MSVNEQQEKATNEDRTALADEYPSAHEVGGTDQVVSVAVEGMQPQSGDTTGSPSGKNREDREAARYRTKLRETEAELERVNALLTVIRRQVAEDIAKQGTSNSRGLPKPDLMWLLGVKVEDLLDESGRVDPSLVGNAVDGVRETTGINNPQPYIDRSQGKGPSQGPPVSPVVEAFMLPR